jgi:hypothetical protein
VGPGPIAAALVACAVAVVVCAPARADTTELDRAREAYDRGAASFDRGDFGAALDDLERADALVPNAVTLELALKAALHTDEPLRAMALVDRADERSATGPLAATADQVRHSFEARTGRVTVVCPVPLSCSAEVDGASIDVGSPQRLLAGDHVLGLIVDGRRSQVPFSLRGHGTSEILASAYAPTPTPAPQPGVDVTAPAPQPKRDVPVSQSSRDGLPPAVFWVGLGATAILAGAATASGIDTINKHADFSAGGSTTATDGIAAQTRTNVLLAVTGAVAVTTAAVGLFAVRWGNSKSSGSNALVISGMHVVFTRNF